MYWSYIYLDSSRTFTRYIFFSVKYNLPLEQLDRRAGLKRVLTHWTKWWQQLAWHPKFYTWGWPSNLLLRQPQHQWPQFGKDELNKEKPFSFLYFICKNFWLTIDIDLDGGWKRLVDGLVFSLASELGAEITATQLYPNFILAGASAILFFKRTHFAWKQGRGI